MFSINSAVARLTIALAASGFLGLAPAARADGPHLTLDDIDQLSRDKVVRQLKGTGDTGAPASANLAAPLPATTALAPAPTGTPLRKVDSPRMRADPVVFVGAYGDGASNCVLYETGGGVYPARLGTKLMNGWTAQKVSGYLVTVSDGKRVWTEPIRGGAAPGVVNSPTLQAISDLGGPLPPGAMATPIYPGK